MKLFIDSGNIKDIETLAAIGIIDGVTTNPTLLSKEPGDYRENLKKICQIVKGPVSGEVTEINGLLADSPEKLNEDPHGAAWLVKLKLSAPAEAENLMTAAEYQTYVGAEK